MTNFNKYDNIKLPRVDGARKLYLHNARRSEFIEKAGATICTQLLKQAENSIRSMREI